MSAQDDRERGYREALTRIVEEIAAATVATAGETLQRVAKVAERALRQHGEPWLLPPGTNPVRGESSESRAWRDVARLARQLNEGARPISQVARDLLALAMEMQAQLSAGVHVNPGRLVALLANPVPPRRGHPHARDVLWIIYRHADDNRVYGHAFGTEDFDIKVMRGGDIRLTGTAESSRVEARDLEDGTAILRHRDGLRVWEDL